MKGPHPGSHCDMCVNKTAISASCGGVLEMFDLEHKDDKTLSRGENIDTRDFNLLASSGLAEFKPA